MKLAFREAALDDFACFYDHIFPGERDNACLRGIVEYEWRVLLDNSAAISMVVEDGARPAGRRIVGCGQLAFVTDSFVRWARSGQSPKINIQATHPLPDGSRPLLTRAEVARANGGDGLNGLFIRWGRADCLLGPAEQREVGRFMHDASVTLTRGYQFKELLIQAYGAAAHEQALRAGFLDRDRYDGFCRSQPSRPGDLPVLMGLTREEATHREGCVMAHFFIHHPPRFGFTASQQKMLRLSVRRPDFSDAALAETLGVSVGAVKNWWPLIYARVSKADPDLLPQGDADGARGPEKRRPLLHYLREHPEELRPYKPPRRGGSGLPSARSRGAAA